MPETQPSSTLTDADIRKIARLSRLAVPDDQIPAMREKIGAALGYIERLRSVDLEGVEPMANPAAVYSSDSPDSNRLDDDAIGKMLPTQALMDMAPATSHGQFILVPKVLDGEGGGA
ncbi:MAG: Asp-tRNA(Asn)/Glu-tRNA(Gln) amidotransferase subunit GatC [Phycisphaeraceae bacterium]|nr:Asp-tRNA(Asn)/Glu-tRNA(Gln) amidotransferase subunit GatC [Phycisphaerales bacterium]MCB9859476.1 Asp-tRNA(Asn)/Glu-tRNA(Gln) amidotransferase subunit GatC [Phycisphaeraceae bacterium]